MSRMIRWRALAALLASMTLSACVYSIDIQQGNLLESKDIDRVAVGMTRVQVRSLLGTPMVSDPFEGQRWDYVYYLKRSRSSDVFKQHFIVYFEGDKVTRIDRSDKPANADETPPVASETAPVASQS